jgi:hypothetical protein
MLVVSSLTVMVLTFFTGSMISIPEAEKLMRISNNPAANE